MGLERTYYNEIDDYAADWLENLMIAGEIPFGIVDRRDIRDVKPEDLEDFTQCHFFAGIGGWPRALCLSGWPDDRPLWTGSCPCQPFSAAGKRKGADDERHLWPAFRWLIDQRRPAKIFGEQVASKDGRAWGSGVRSDLEALGYGVGIADLCSASAGAAHIRQRLFWTASQRLADSDTGQREQSHEKIQAGRTAIECSGSHGGMADADQGQRGRLTDGEERQRDGETPGRQQGDGLTQSCGETERLGDASIGGVGAQHRQPSPDAQPQEQVGGSSLSSGLGIPDSAGPQPGREAAETARHGNPSNTASCDGRMDHALSAGLQGHSGDVEDGRQSGRLSSHEVGPATEADRLDFVPCADGKVRRFEPGSFPLAHALPRSVGPGSTKEQRVELMAAKANRVGRLRGYGNAIDSVLASEFIKASGMCR